MSVKIRPYKKRGRKGWEVDIVLKMPSGDTIRERVKSPVSSISGTKSWALLRELQLLQHGKPKDAEKVPTLEAFTPRFMESYVRANRQKPSTIESKQAIIDGWLHPHLGKKPLNEINDEDVQALKSEMKSKHPKTVNNVLTVLSKVLKIGVKWKVIAVMPVQIELLKFEQREIEFYDDEQYPRLVDGSVKVGERPHLTVLLGGDLGARTGEMIALEWSDIDFKRGVITISKSEWNGHVTLPKGGRSRKVPMTKKLASALLAHRHLRGPRVLYRDDGTTVSKQTLTTWMTSAQKRAGLKMTGNKHILRHTFCSHLAMRGATVIAIKELAGHRSIRTTMRYMHLSPAHKEKAIELLDQARSHEEVGDILETAKTATGSVAVGDVTPTPETTKAPSV